MVGSAAASARVRGPWGDDARPEPEQVCNETGARDLPGLISGPGVLDVATDAQLVDTLAAAAHTTLGGS